MKEFNEKIQQLLQQQKNEEEWQKEIENDLENLPFSYKVLASILHDQNKRLLLEWIDVLSQTMTYIIKKRDLDPTFSGDFANARRLLEGLADIQEHFFELKNDTVPG